MVESNKLKCLKIHLQLHDVMISVLCRVLLFFCDLFSHSGGHFEHLRWETTQKSKDSPADTQKTIICELCSVTVMATDRHNLFYHQQAKHVSKTTVTLLILVLLR